MRHANDNKDKKCEQFCFLEYFKVLRAQKRKMVKTGSILHKICLGWQCKEGRRAELSATSALALMALDFIGGCVQIIHRNIMMALIDKGDGRAKTHFGVIDGTETWGK